MRTQSQTQPNDRKVEAKCPRGGAGGGTASLHADNEFVAAAFAECKYLKFFRLVDPGPAFKLATLPFILERLFLKN